MLGGKDDTHFKLIVSAFRLAKHVQKLHSRKRLDDLKKSQLEKVKDIQ